MALQSAYRSRFERDRMRWWRQCQGESSWCMCFASERYVTSFRRMTSRSELIVPLFPPNTFTLNSTLDYLCTNFFFYLNLSSWETQKNILSSEIRWLLCLKLKFDLIHYETFVKSDNNFFYIFDDPIDFLKNTKAFTSDCFWLIFSCLVYSSISYCGLMIYYTPPFISSECLQNICGYFTIFLHFSKHTCKILHSIFNGRLCLAAKTRMLRNRVNDKHTKIHEKVNENCWTSNVTLPLCTSNFLPKGAPPSKIFTLSTNFLCVKKFSR